MISHYTATWVPENEFESFETPVWPMTDKDGRRWDKDVLRQEHVTKWQPPAAGSQPVHVGEWRCYNKTPHSACLGWMRDVTAVWREMGWGWALAYLMLEAAEALGIDTAPTLAVGKRMLDHALRTGWDPAAGGFVEAGYYLAGDTALTVTDPTKNWWAQAEGLNTLLLFGDLYPDDPMRYHDRFLQLWGYTQAYLIDHEHGGWYPGGIDRQPEMRTADKGGIWKASYHDGRALMNCVRRLRE